MSPGPGPGPLPALTSARGHEGTSTRAHETGPPQNPVGRQTDCRRTGAELESYWRFAKKLVGECHYMARDDAFFR
jgi:hypothetical protein